MIVIVDTNVAVVANGKSDQASPDCILTCTNYLESIMDHGQVLLDSHWNIIGEYQDNLNDKGQPGVGDRFLRWVLLNQATCRCIYVVLTPKKDDTKDFEEFPSDQRLKNFDRSDRKWIAGQQAHLDHPPILQATDAKWWNFREAFQALDIKVEFICEADIQRLLSS